MIFGSGIGLVLSLVFGCIVLALVGELYYLVWCKKQVSSKLPGCNSNVSNRVSVGTKTECSKEEALDTEVQDAVVEAELLRIQSRLLFTINEETKEDLESEPGRGRSRTKSLSDLILAVESSMEVNGLCSSPPPKLKFLRDAEEKLHKRLMLENRLFYTCGDNGLEEAKDGSFVRILFGRTTHSFNHSQFTK